MKEAADEKTEPLSPPRVVSTWGNSSPFKMSNPSPPRSMLQTATPADVISGADQADAKRIADGFLSEVSTPDNGSKNGRDGVSSVETKKQSEDTSELSPQKPLPAACNELEVRDEYIEQQIDGESRNTLGSPKILHPGRTLKGEEERDCSLKPEVPCGNETACQAAEGQLNRGIALKRKGISANEEKVQRKRLKIGTSERCRGKLSAQWSHLSEEELKKLRRVKNRESVEKCRTKQRLRMEALQVEQTCLRLENKKLREAITLINEAVRDVSIQVTKTKVHVPNHADEQPVKT